jgi:hypothetical protein
VGGAGTGAARWSLTVLVKVGAGSYTDTDGEWEDVENLRKGALLKTLKADEMFKVKLAGVDLSGCTVWCLVSQPVDGGRRLSPVCSVSSRSCRSLLASVQGCATALPECLDLPRPRSRACAPTR